MTKEEFVEFHAKHPDLDNSEYYAEFPDISQSTIRSWKSSVRTQNITPPTPQPLPIQAVANDNNEYEEQTNHYITLMMTQTGTKASELEGVDEKSKILILKNKLKNLQLQPTNRAANSSILPSPSPIGQNQNKFGIDEYIAFNDVNGILQEIKMEIPMSKLMNPVENEKIRGKQR